MRPNQDLGISLVLDSIPSTQTGVSNSWLKKETALIGIRLKSGVTDTQALWRSQCPRCFFLLAIGRKAYAEPLCSAEEMGALGSRGRIDGLGVVTAASVVRKVDLWLA